MENITVNKNDLMKTLRTNQQEHEAQYAAAIVKYREKLIEELDKKLARAKEGKPVKHQFYLPIPENFTDDFETAIQMLEWAQGDTVDLSYRDFQRFVQNKWEWNDRFASNTTAYLVG